MRQQETQLETNVRFRERRFNTKIPHAIFISRQTPRRKNLFPFVFLSNNGSQIPQFSFALGMKSAAGKASSEKGERVDRNLALIYVLMEC